MSRGIFSPDNPLMITMSQITDCIFLSLFWMLGCIPVVTIGVSAAALYDAVYHGFHRGDKHNWQRFLSSFRQNLKPGIVPTVVFLAVSLSLGKVLISLWNSAVAGALSWMVFSGAAFAGVLLFGILSLMFPVLSRFENSFAGLVKNTFFLSMANLPRTLIIGIINGLSVVLCALYVFPLFFLPALSALICSVFIEPMFKPYMPEEKDAA